MSFELDANNEFSVVGEFLHNTKLTELQIQERKFMYIEGLIRFLEIFAQNEIGNVEVDIEKIALWVNSPYFENVDIYSITSIEKIYDMLTTDIIDKNIPLYRFLKLDNYKLNIFEKEHKKQLIEDFNADGDKYPCLKCIWYENKVTSFGTLSKCHCDIETISGQFKITNPGYHDITLAKNRKCKYITTITNYDEFIDKYIINNPKITRKHGFGGQRTLLRSAENGKKLWLQKIENLDNSYIPTFIPDAYKVILSNKTDMYEDFIRVFNSKKSKSEMQYNLRFAIFLEAMIKFVEIYAQTEIGTDYYADITNIAKYIINNKEIFNFNSKEDIYVYLETGIINNTINIKQLIKRKYN